MRPVRLHLDTSDYSAMYLAAPGTPPASVRDELREMAQGGRLEIGLSYHVVFELLKKAEPEFRDDRLARARLLTELCGRNAFPYPTDLGHGYDFSTEGLWVPRIDLEETEVERLVEEVVRAMAHHLHANRNERRVFSKRKNFTQWVRCDPERARRLAHELWPLRFGQTFAESGDLNRYILGEMTRSDANKKLWFYITDPVTVYKIWFEQYGRDDPIVDRRDQIASTFVVMLEELNAIQSEGADIHAKVAEAFAATGDDGLSPEGRDRLTRLKADLKTFRAQMSSPQDLYERVPRWRELFGDQSALVASQILYAFHREGRAIKPSDGIDFVHAIYLPHTDLWRGDKAFSDLLIKHGVNFNERVVPTLAELPGRIEAEIAKMREG
jgi:hypothetical protein